jgi:DNA-binding CsgD family transcriptional regulator
MLHASPLTGQNPGTGVIIEQARTPTLSDVIANGYGLTPREREVAALAARGRATKQIASNLAISLFTVKDHLKAVYAKVGVQSRAELVATLYMQHYEPQPEAGATPSPYGWYLDDHTRAAS